MKTIFSQNPILTVCGYYTFPLYSRIDNCIILEMHIQNHINNAVTVSPKRCLYVTYRYVWTESTAAELSEVIYPPWLPVDAGTGVESNSSSVSHPGLDDPRVLSIHVLQVVKSTAAQFAIKQCIVTYTTGIAWHYQHNIIRNCALQWHVFLVWLPLHFLHQWSRKTNSLSSTNSLQYSIINHKYSIINWQHFLGTRCAFMPTSLENKLTQRRRSNIPKTYECIGAARQSVLCSVMGRGGMHLFTPQILAPSSGVQINKYAEHVIFHDVISVKGEKCFCLLNIWLPHKSYKIIMLHFVPPKLLFE